MWTFDRFRAFCKVPRGIAGGGNALPTRWRSVAVPSLAALPLLLIVPLANAQPVHVHMRLVAGDSRHYTSGVHSTYLDANSGEQRTADATTGLAQSIESVMDDGSARVRETIDSVDVPEGQQTPSYLGLQYVWTMHPDGSSSDYQIINGDSVRTLGDNYAIPELFPATGLEVGQETDTVISFALPLAAQAPRLPMHVKFDGLLTDEDRPAGRLLEGLHVTNVDVPIASASGGGTGKLNADIDFYSIVSLDTGWPLHGDGVTAYHLEVPRQDQSPRIVDVRFEVHTIMDDENLSAD